MKNQIFTIFSASVFLFKICNAQVIDTVKFTFNFKNQSLPVAIINFNDSKVPKEKIPMLLFLHGAGERGIDNEIQLKGGIPSIVKILKSEKYGSFIMVAPQCPKDQKWVTTDWTLSAHQMEDQMSWPLAATVALLDSILNANKQIDQSRLYLSGLSMGGFGTWELLQRFPDKFTAAIPVCGGGDTSLACRISKVPVWAFHGKKDKVVLVNRTTDMVSKMKLLNKNVKMTIFPNDGHYIWKKVYENKGVIRWFFSKRKIQ